MRTDAFTGELMRRSPLAASVLDIYDHVFDDAMLSCIWESHRGRCYEDVLTFPNLLRFTRDALLRHGGSGHKLFLELESDKRAPVDESNFYRKLSKTPQEVSRALLRQCTQRLEPLLPQEAAASLPRCFDNYRVVIFDAKTVKRVAGKLKPARGYAGALLGAKALVALDARSGMALAFSDSLDGMSNEVPLVPALMPQLYEVAGLWPLLTVMDRAFDDVKTMRCLSARGGDAFVTRTKQAKNAVFIMESAVEMRDAQGRRILDEIGLLGKVKPMRVRRITLFRNAAEHEEDVTLLTNLLDRDCHGVAGLLELYRRRWGIEQVFQQVTQTFALDHLIGCSPKATLFQFAFCLLLYNLMQVVKTYVAADGKVLAGVVSMYYLFDDVRKELQAWAYHTDGSWPRVPRTAEQMRQHLRKLLTDSWDAVRYTKASDKRPRAKAQPKRRLHGGHSSVQRLLEGRAQVILT